jgi:hypothetical protein
VRAALRAIKSFFVSVRVIFKISMLGAPTNIKRGGSGPSLFLNHADLLGSSSNVLSDPKDQRFKHFQFFSPHGKGPIEI